jgi:hypothetical protein
MENEKSIQIKNTVDLNKMLTGVLMQLKRGEVSHEYAKSVSLVADKINKNNSNAIQYKSVCKHKEEVDFFKDC